MKEKEKKNFYNEKEYNDKSEDSIKTGANASNNSNNNIKKNSPIETLVPNKIYNCPSEPKTSNLTEYGKMYIKLIYDEEGQLTREKYMQDLENKINYYQNKKGIKLEVEEEQLNYMKYLIKLEEQKNNENEESSIKNKIEKILGIQKNNKKKERQIDKKSDIFFLDDSNNGKNYSKNNKFKVKKGNLGRKTKREKENGVEGKKNDENQNNGQDKILRKCGIIIGTILNYLINKGESKNKIFKEYYLDKKYISNEKNILEKFFPLKIRDYIKISKQRNSSDVNKEKNNKLIFEKENEINKLKDFLNINIFDLIEMYINDKKSFEKEINGKKESIELGEFETFKDLKKKKNKEYPTDVKDKFKKKIKDLLIKYKKIIIFIK